MGLRDRLEAKARGEVSTAALAAYSSASSDAYDLLDTLPPLGAARLSAWCAFVLQTHADNLLGSGSCPGMVSPEAWEEAQVHYQLAAAWLSRARQAAATEAYTLDVSVPQPLPKPRAPRTPGVLKAMRKTLEAVQARAGADLAARSADPIAARLTPLMASVQSAIDSAGALSADSAGFEVRVTVGTTMQAGLDRAYQVGQLLALPELMSATPAPDPGPATHDSSTLALFLPGDAGFDPWCLTDPLERQQREEYATLVERLDAFWKSDPEPQKSLAIQAEISAAIESGAVQYLPEGTGLALSRIASRCPWPGVLYTTTALTIAGTELASGACFVLDVGPGENGFRHTITTRPSAGAEAAAPAETDRLGRFLDRLAGDGS